jgi:outer membrane protein OmpA-like peptidoglycan-associated protein
LAQWLNENADYNLLIVGHADKETGSPKINMELSHKRAVAVQKHLLSKGVKNERIAIDAKGDTEQPYAKPEQNRVALCIVK